MPTRAIVFALSITATGLAIAIAGCAHWNPVDPELFLLLLALNAAASTLKIKIPGITGTISPSFVFLLSAISRLSWVETAAIAGVGGLVQVVWRAKVQPTLLQIAFNVSCLIVCSSLAHRVANTSIDSMLEGAMLPLAVAALVLLVSNTTLVAIVVALVQGSPVRQAVRVSQFWAFPYYTMGAMVAHLFLRADLGLSLAYFAVLAMFLIHTFYGGLIERFGDR